MLEGERRDGSPCRAAPTTGEGRGRASGRGRAAGTAFVPASACEREGNGAEGTVVAARQNKVQLNELLAALSSPVRGARQP